MNLCTRVLHHLGQRSGPCLAADVINAFPGVKKQGGVIVSLHTLHRAKLIHWTDAGWRITELGRAFVNRALSLRFSDKAAPC